MEDADLNRLAWRKARRSSHNGGDCVEVAADGRRIAVRDSKGRHGPVLAFTEAGWEAFLRGAKTGQFDGP